MAIEVVPATPSDIPRCVEIEYDGFGYHPMEIALNGPNTEANRNKIVKRILRQMEHDRSLHIVKAIDTAEQDKIVGFCIWSIYTKHRPETEYLKPHFMFAGEDIDSPVQKAKVLEMQQPMFAARIELMAGNPNALLTYVCVEKQYQRRGAGGALVEWGLKRCDELGIDAYLEATEMGKPVYEKRGFEVVKFVEMVEKKPDGSEVIEHMPVMRRRPKKLS